MERRSAIVIVSDDQLSLAIGNEGENARLAAKLTGYRISINGEKVVAEPLSSEDEEPSDTDKAEEEKPAKPKARKHRQHLRKSQPIKVRVKEE